jgi:hypothetical protein
MTHATGGEIANLLAEAREHVAHITANLPVAVDVLAIPWTTSKAPYIALCSREAQTWRAEEFARAACDMFERGDLVVGVANTRGAVESVGAIWYLKCLVEEEVARGGAADGIYDKLRQLHLGSRVEETMPQAINVITMLKRADKDIPGVWESYERMSEFGHPNYSGAAGVFGEPDRETLITHFGRGIRKNSYPAQLGLKCLIGSLGMLEFAYNRIGGLLEPFSLACESALIASGEKTKS